MALNAKLRSVLLCWLLVLLLKLLLEIDDQTTVRLLGREVVLPWLLDQYAIGTLGIDTLADDLDDEVEVLVDNHRHVLGEEWPVLLESGCLVDVHRLVHQLAQTKVLGLVLPQHQQAIGQCLGKDACIAQMVLGLDAVQIGRCDSVPLRSVIVNVLEWAFVRPRLAGLLLRNKHVVVEPLAIASQYRPPGHTKSTGATTA
jgi:hypothetical protein